MRFMPRLNLSTCVLALLVLASLLPLTALYSSTLFWALMVVSISVPLLVWLWRSSLSLVAMSSAVTWWFGSAVATAYGSGDRVMSFASLARVPRTALDSIPAVLSVAPPIERLGAPHIVGLTIAVTASALCVVVSTLSSAGGRALTLGIAAVTFSISVVLSSPANNGSILFGALLIAAMVLWLASWGDGRGSGRSLMVSVAVCAAVVVLAGMMAPRDRPEIDIRSADRIDVRPISSDDPLGDVFVQLSGPERAVFDVRAVTGQLGRLLPELSLDSYDGTVWSTTREFRTVDARMARSSVRSELLQPVEADIRWNMPLAKYGGVPHVGWPVSVDGLRVGLDATSGSLQAFEPLPAGRSYRVAGVTINDRDLATRVQAPRPPGGQGSLDRALAVPSQGQTSGCSMADIGQVATDLTDGARTDLDRMVALTQALTKDRTLDLGSGPGHSMFHVCRLLGLVDRGGRVDGQPEQYAAAAALMARSLGIPTRVVVGWRVPDGQTDGWSQMTTADRHAWVESFVGGAGWIPFDPTPIERGTTPPPSAAASPVGATPPPQTQPTSTVPPTTVPADSNLDALRPTPSSSIELWFLLFGALGVLGALSIPALRRMYYRQRRNFRRHNGTPAQRVWGAWSEWCDVVRRRGAAVNPSMTTAQVVQISVECFEDAQVGAACRSLASIVNRSCYGTLPVDDHDADQAWRLLERAEMHVLSPRAHPVGSEPEDEAQGPTDGSSSHQGDRFEALSTG